MVKGIGTEQNYKEGYCSTCGNIKEKDSRGWLYCRTCKNEYDSQWRQANRDHVKQYRKQYMDSITKDEYLYGMLMAERESLYIGSTCNQLRPRRHLRGQTHLELEPRDWIELGLSKIVYVNVTDLVYNRWEREVLEGFAIEDIEPLLNECIPNKDRVNVDRIEELRDMYREGLPVEYRTIDIEKVTNPDGQVTFKFDTIKLN